MPVGVDFQAVEHSRIPEEQREVYEKVRRIILDVLIDNIGIRPDIAETMVKPSMRFNLNNQYDTSILLPLILDAIEQTIQSDIDLFPLIKPIITVLDLVEHLVERVDKIQQFQPV